MVLNPPTAHRNMLPSCTVVHVIVYGNGYGSDGPARRLCRRTMVRSIAKSDRAEDYDSARGFPLNFARRK